MINEHEYKFLSQQWDGPIGAAYNQVFEFCRQYGLTVGFDHKGRPILTPKGIAAIKAYQAEDNYKRIDVI
jgi:hypothetical protein